MWYEQANRIVASDMIRGVHVSTVFLGVDHNCGPVGEPILFETMIFGGEHDYSRFRYCTWEEAKEGHQAACELVVESNSDLAAAETILKNVFKK